MTRKMKARESDHSSANIMKSLSSKGDMGEMKNDQTIDMGATRTTIFWKMFQQQL
ncbi:hypothetical protein RchiOBHm_Chr5g0027711 [Rosa chinensis]|uniref:Uncharacterized protein n=1 Tax=Rosa chinensis TaxID=74649 RepID=A0A2P6Q972_ROSCH|nr:hypothetical protein RchiOBHm_Chr5g0027711 [Rosa chinensis]